MQIAVHYPTGRLRWSHVGQICSCSEQSQSLKRLMTVGGPARCCERSSLPPVDTADHTSRTSPSQLSATGSQQNCSASVVQVWLFSLSRRLHSSLPWTESIGTVPATTQNIWLMLCSWRCLDGHRVFCSICPSSVLLGWRAWCGRVGVLLARLDLLSLWRTDGCLDLSWLVCRPPFAAVVGNLTACLVFLLLGLDFHQPTLSCW